MTYRAVLFDAFCTLVETKCRRHPFRSLIKLGMSQGLMLGAVHLRLVMSATLTLAESAERLGIVLVDWKLRELEDDLEAELESIVPFPDALQAVEMLETAGVSIAACSNLAAPYGPRVKRHFPNLDAYAFSYQLGVLKPDPLAYEWPCAQMGVYPAGDLTPLYPEVAMVGDSIRCDRDGPAAIGMAGFHLHRQGRGDVRNLIEFAELILEARACHR